MSINEAEQVKTRSFIAFFDLDGTLIDSMSTVRSLLAEGLDLKRSDPSASDGSIKLPDEYLGPPEESILTQYVDAAKAKWYVHQYREYLASRELKVSREFANQVISVTRGLGFKIAIITNKSSLLARESLEALDVVGFCDAVVDGCCTEGPKPAPGGLLRTIQELGGSRKTSVLVGDTLTDELTARAAGIPFIRAWWFAGEDVKQQPQLNSGTNDVFRHIYNISDLCESLKSITELQRMDKAGRQGFL